MAEDPKRTRTAAQLANDERMRKSAQERRLLLKGTQIIQEASVEVESGPPPVSTRQSFLARHGRLTPRMTLEDAADLVEHDEDRRVPLGNVSPGKRQHTAAGQITVEHLTDEKVKMWKKGPFGWMPREVPVHTIAANLDNGWMEYCPDCGGTDCTLEPNSCPGKTERRFILCPVADPTGKPCGKKIFATGLPQAEDDRVHENGGDPLEVSGVYTLNPEIELKAKMDIHLMTFHRDEARSLGLFGGATPYARLGMETDILVPAEPTPA